MAILPDRSQNKPRRDLLKRIYDQSANINVNQLIDENVKLESELHLTLEEIAHLQNAVANANMKLIAMKNSSGKAATSEKRQISALAEELKEVYIPLNTIGNYCELLLSESVGMLGSLQQRFVERIVIATEQIRDLLDGFQKIEEIKSITPLLAKDAWDLHSVLEQVLSRNSSLLQEKQLVLQMEVPDELPQISGGADDLNRIIELMVKNALMITPKDGSICITAYPEKILSTEKVTLKIRDGGPGIPANELKKLFPYQRDNNPGEVPGLALTNSEFSHLIDLVQKLGCKFKLSNAIGFGSVFEVTFGAAA
jgi:signal transduction histidine kinase